ncbi:MAG: PAS domain S-box protein [Desulfobacterales bacterium]|nr:PAS domain S-box protein [Desulfobacterales bacterium]
MRLFQIFNHILQTPLLRYFLITGVIVSVVFPLFTVLFIIPSISGQLTDNTEDDAVRTASYIDHLLMSPGRPLAKGLFTDDVILSLELLKKNFQLEKLKVFSAQGDILFSTDRAEIGDRNSHDYFYSIVAKGNVHSEVVQKNTETMEGRILEQDVVETYVPVIISGEFGGAFEIYYDITDRKANLERLLGLIYLVLISIDVILMVFVVFVLFKASSSMLKREQAETALEKSRDELEIKVRERTEDLKRSNEKLTCEIKERMMIQTALQESEERFRSISESAQDAIIMMDKNGAVNYWNKASEKIFQYTDDEVINKNLHSLIAPEAYCERIQKRVGEFMKSGRGKAIGHTIEVTAIRKNGETFPVEVSLSAVKIKGDWNAIGIVRDISDRVAAVAEREKAQARLLLAQKMESIGNLAGGIAHDFNNILSSILGFTELGLKSVVPGTTLEGDLQEVYGAAKRAKDLVWQILTFARQSEERSKPIQAHTIIKEVLRLIRSSIPSTIEIRQDINSHSFINGNPTQMHQIMMNLCSNAAHAMEDGGGILEVCISDISVGNSSSLLKEGVEPGAYMEIRVSDTGTGIPPDIIGSIFEPYFTTKAKEEGTGMGLAIVHGIVESNNGKILVESQVGLGTVFKLYFPVTEKDEKQWPCEIKELPHGTERILFVDDEIPIAKMSNRVLEGLGYAVTTETSSVDALALFRRNPDAFDLVITDMTMPGMTGDALASQMMTIRPDIPVVLCTGYYKNISEESVLKTGIRALIHKPVTREKMAGMIREVLDGERSVSPA